MTTNMSSEVVEAKLPMKVVINIQKNKFLFAEVDNNFADVLLSFMTLPLGQILRLFQKHCRDNNPPVIGSLNTLYKSLEDIGEDHFCTKECKQMLLNPTNSLQDYCSKLKINIDDSLPTKFFVCRKCCKQKDSNKRVAMYFGEKECSCTESMNATINVPKLGISDGFISELIEFAISDDIQMVDDLLGCLSRNLHCFGITDVDAAEQRILQFGLPEIIELLRAMFSSRTPLTDIVCNGKVPNHLIGNPINMHQLDKGTESKKMTVRAVLQKSTKKILFVQADGDFVDFLFSLLTIPLGSVVSLLGTTSLHCIDNLYTSIRNLKEKLLKSDKTKSMLLNPNLASMFLSKNQIFPLTEEENKLSSFSDWAIIDPKGTSGCYISNERVYMVTNDLTVTPFSMFSTVSLCNVLKIHIFDVEIVDVEIGLPQALGILKEALTSNAVWTNALQPLLFKEPKQQKEV